MYVTQYGQACIARPNDMLGAPPDDIPTQHLATLARYTARLRRARLEEDSVSVVVRIVSAITLFLTGVIIILSVWWIPEPEIVSISGHKPTTYPFASLATLYEIASLKEYAYNATRSWSQLIIWVSLVVLGYIYCGVHLGRRIPIASIRGQFWEFCLTFALSFPFFFLFPMFTLAGRYIPSSGTTTFITKTILEPIPMHHLWMQYIVYASYNLLFFFLPYFMGLNIPLFVNCKWFRVQRKRLHHMNRFYSSAFLYISIATVLCIGGIVILFHLGLIIFSRIGIPYFIIFVIGALMVFAVALLTIKWVVVVPRSWMVLLGLMALCRFFNPISTATMGFVLGLFLERVCRWGYPLPYDRLSYSKHRKEYQLWLTSEADPSDMQPSYRVLPFVHDQTITAADLLSERHITDAETQNAVRHMTSPSLPAVGAELDSL